MKFFEIGAKNHKQTKNLLFYMVKDILTNSVETCYDNLFQYQSIDKLLTDPSKDKSMDPSIELWLICKL